MRNPIHNRKGQLVIENVLLLVATVGFLSLATNELKNRKILAKFIGEPWSKVAGMIESGVWAEPDKARPLHPNQYKRSITADPTQ